MGIKKFFKKIGSGIKKGALWVKDKFHKAAPYIKKFSKIVEKGSELASLLPGEYGAAARGINAVAKVANGALDKIPDGSVKNKAKSAVDSATTKTHQVFNKGMDVVNKGVNIANKANDWVQRGQNMYNMFSGLVK